MPPTPKHGKAIPSVPSAGRSRFPSSWGPSHGGTIPGIPSAGRSRFPPSWSPSHGGRGRFPPSWNPHHGLPKPPTHIPTPPKGGFNLAKHGKFVAAAVVGGALYGGYLHGKKKSNADPGSTQGIRRY